jgi:hypothetical protein
LQYFLFKNYERYLTESAPSSLQLLLSHSFMKISTNVVVSEGEEISIPGIMR